MELKDKQEILKAIKEPVPNNRIMSNEFDKYLIEINEKLDAMTDEEFIELMANVLEDMEIAKMIEERKKNDDGKRYTMKDLDELFDRRMEEELIKSENELETLKDTYETLNAIELPSLDVFKDFN